MGISVAAISRNTFCNTAMAMLTPGTIKLWERFSVSCSPMEIDCELKVTLSSW